MRFNPCASTAVAPLRSVRKVVRLVIDDAPDVIRNNCRHARRVDFRCPGDVKKVPLREESISVATVNIGVKGPNVVMTKVPEDPALMLGKGWDILDEPRLGFPASALACPPSPSRLRSRLKG